METQINYLILISTPIDKKSGGNKNWNLDKIKNLKIHNTFINLNYIRDKNISKLKKSIENEPKEILEYLFLEKGDKLKKILNQIKNIYSSPTMQVIDRINSKILNNSKLQNININLKNNLIKSLIFLDPIFGILKPYDLIPEYNLKYNTICKNKNILKILRKEMKEEIKNLFKNKIIIDIADFGIHKIIYYSSFVNYFRIRFVKEIKINNTIEDLNKKESDILKAEFLKTIISKTNISKKDLIEFKTNDGKTIYSDKFSTGTQIIFIKSN